MGWIILLIVLGILLFIAELVLLPGLTVAAIGSFCALVGAVVLAFAQSDTEGWIVLAIVLVIITILTVIFLRANTWKNVALKTSIPDALNNMPKAKVGDIGKALTRLAPMGKIVIADEVIEAKTMGGYIDEGSHVEVIGFDNMNLIVKLK